ncbi:MAG: ATPase, T2SS/T4P/T4SS family [Erysipelotrichales bacterium]
MEKTLNYIVEYALKNQCSDIHLDFKDDCTDVYFRKQGSFNKDDSLSLNNISQLYNYIIFKANLDILDKNILHTGTISFEYKNKIIYLRISIIPTFDNKSIVIRLLNNNKRVNLDNISLIKENIDTLKSIQELKSGLVLFCGKTGSGKTTTLYSIINMIQERTNKKIITLEDPIETKLKNVLQISINHDTLTFFDVFKQVLRHDPDIIVIGEIRDSKDLQLVVQAVLSGHLVLSSMHAMSAQYAINRLLDLNINKHDLKASLRLIAYQELIFTNTNAYALYEFLDENILEQILNKKKVKYKTIDEYKQSIRKRIDFNEGK